MVGGHRSVEWIGSRASNENGTDSNFASKGEHSVTNARGESIRRESFPTFRHGWLRFPSRSVKLHGLIRIWSTSLSDYERGEGREKRSIEAEKRAFRTRFVSIPLFFFCPVAVRFLPFRFYPLSFFSLSFSTQHPRFRFLLLIAIHFILIYYCCWCKFFWFGIIYN